LYDLYVLLMVKDPPQVLFVYV